MAKRKFFFLICTVILVSTSTRAELKFVAHDLSPFSYLENGRVAGPIVDVIREVCNEKDIRCSFKLMQ